MITDWMVAVLEDPTDRFISEVKNGYLPTDVHRRAWEFTTKGLPEPPPDFVVDPLEEEPLKFWDGAVSVQGKREQVQKLVTEGHPQHCAAGIVWMGMNCVCELRTT